MLDWDITEQALPPLSEEDTPPPPQRTRRGFYLVIAALVVIGVVIAGVVVWRFREREAILTADLLGQIRVEESARRVGDRSRIPDLIAPGLPRAWRDRFNAQFQSPDAELTPVDIVIETVEFTGVQARVTVRMGAQRQRRAYEQTAQGWRRVPLPITDETFGRVVIGRNAGVELYKRESDSAFAETLAADIPALWEDIHAWNGTPQSTMLANFIEIRPEEFSPGLLEVEASPPRIVVNSPQVVALPAQWTTGGDSAVRAAVAQGMWSLLPPPRLNSVNLPGGNRFVRTLHTVWALRWALPPEEYTALTAQWLAQSRKDTWHTPFFPPSTVRGEPDPFAPTAADAALLAAADRLAGSMVHPVPPRRIRLALEQASHWDAFLASVVGQTTVAFEAELRGIAAPPLVEMPFTATPARNGNPPGEFRVEVDGQAQPIIIERPPGLPLHLPDGTELDGRCAALFGELQIDGIWREAGLRLSPTRMEVPTLTLPTTFTTHTPPPDTVAYVASYGDPLSTMSMGISQLNALTPDGSLTPVLVPDAAEITPFGGTGWGLSNSTTGILLTIPGTEGCAAQWYLRYVPGKGITGAWLAQYPGLNAYLLPRWDDISGRGILVAVNGTDPALDQRDMPFWWLDEGDPALLAAPDGYLPGGTTALLAPSAASIMLYQMAHRDTGRAAVVILDAATRAEQAVYHPPTPDHYGVDFAYSANGDFLYLVWQIPATVNGIAEGTVLQQVEIATGTTTEWASPGDGSIFFVATDTRFPFLYAMTFTTQREPGGVRLVTFSENGSTPLGNGGEAFGISMVLRCGGGGLLYLRLDTPTDQETRYELDPRYVHIVAASANGTEERLVLPLAASHLPLLCP